MVLFLAYPGVPLRLCVKKLFLRRHHFKETARMAPIIGLLAALAVLMIFVAVYRLAVRPDEVTTRMDSYGNAAVAATPAPPMVQRANWLAQHLKGSKTGDRVGQLLAQADLPLTAAEFVLIVAGVAALGFVLGAWRINMLAGVGSGAALRRLFPFLWAHAGTRQTQARDCGSAARGADAGPGRAQGRLWAGAGD